MARSPHSATVFHFVDTLLDLMRSTGPRYDNIFSSTWGTSWVRRGNISYVKEQCSSHKGAKLCQNAKNSASIIGLRKSDENKP